MSQTNKSSIAVSTELIMQRNLQQTRFVEEEGFQIKAKTESDRQQKK